MTLTESRISGCNYNLTKFCNASSGDIDDSIATTAKSSKISKRLHKSMIELEKNILKKEIERIPEVTSDLENLPDVLITVYFNYKIKGEEFSRRFNLKLQGQITIKEVINKVLNKLESFDYGNYKLMINYESEKFNLKPAKKSGKPNLDLPSYNKTIRLYDTNSKRFTLIYDEMELSFRKKRKCFQSCHIM